MWRGIQEKNHPESPLPRAPGAHTALAASRNGEMSSSLRRYEPDQVETGLALCHLSDSACLQAMSHPGVKLHRNTA